MEDHGARESSPAKAMAADDGGEARAGEAGVKQETSGEFEKAPALGGRTGSRAYRRGDEGSKPGGIDEAPSFVGETKEARGVHPRWIDGEVVLAAGEGEAHCRILGPNGTRFGEGRTNRVGSGRSAIAGERAG